MWYLAGAASCHASPITAVVGVLRMFGYVGSPLTQTWELLSMPRS